MHLERRFKIEGFVGHDGFIKVIVEYRVVRVGKRVDAATRFGNGPRARRFVPRVRLREVGGEIADEGVQGLCSE